MKEYILTIYLPAGFGLSKEVDEVSMAYKKALGYRFKVHVINVEDSFSKQIVYQFTEIPN